MYSNFLLEQHFYSNSSKSKYLVCCVYNSLHLMDHNMLLTIQNKIMVAGYIIYNLTQRATNLPKQLLKKNSYITINQVMGVTPCSFM